MTDFGKVDFPTEEAESGGTLGGGEGSPENIADSKTADIIKENDAVKTNNNGVMQAAILQKTATEVAFPAKQIVLDKQRLLDIQKNFKHRTLRSRNMISKIISMVFCGSNKASLHNVLESLKIDDSWIVNIEGHIRHIDNIVRNPKSSLIENRLIVNTSKAKKTDSETIRYLSSHTSDIESIVQGEIRPARLNIREMDSDLAIYENRFVYALMLRLRSFLEQRYIAIKEQINCFDTNHLRVNSKFDTPNGDVDFELSVKIRDKKADSIDVKENHQLLARIEKCRLHISALMSSDFARTLSKAKLLMPPINKTNVIRIHTDYKGCYNLWLFLSAYTAVGFSVNVEELNLDLENDYYDDLSFIISATVKNMVDNNLINASALGSGVLKRKVKKFKPMKSFSYDPIKRGSIAKKQDVELISQFYYEKIKRLLKECDDVKAKQDEPLHLAFRAYFKGIRQLNNSLFEDALEFKKYREPYRSSSSLDVKKEQLAQYEEGYKRFKLLRTLKESDYNATLKEEQKYADRVENLKKQIDEIKEKQRQELIFKREIEQAKESRQKELERIKAEQAEERAKTLAIEKKLRLKEQESQLKLKEQEKQLRLREREKQRKLKEREKEEEKRKQELEREREKQRKLKEREKEEAKRKQELEREREKQRKLREREKEEAKRKQELEREREKQRKLKEREKEEEKRKQELEREREKQRKLREREKEEAKRKQELEREREKQRKLKEREREQKLREREKEREQRKKDVGKK